MKKITAFKLSLCFCIWLLASCASRSGIPEVSPSALPKPLSVVVYDEVYWPIYTWLPEQAVGDTLRIYIEGMAVHG